ncbi:MAG: glycoside hydrolase family 18 protein [Planctomycetota bacterium]
MPTRIPRRWIIASVLSVLVLGVAGRSVAGESQRLAIGYYAAAAEFPVSQLPWQHFTHLCHAFLVTDENGKPITGERVPSKELTDAAHKNNVKVLLSLGGGKTALGLAKVTASRKALVEYVQAVTSIVAKNGYDGVDIDWEFPRDRAGRTGFVALVAVLRGSLDRLAASQKREDPYLLTAAVSYAGFFGKWIDTGAVMGRLDWLHVMTYDMAGPWSQSAGHHAPLLPSPKDPERASRSVAAAMQYWHKDRGVPKEKLVVGVPLYARAFPVRERYAPLSPDDRKKHGTLSFSQVRQLVGRDWLAEWDDQSRAPWLSPPDEKPLIIAYDDRNSVDQKAKWAKEQGYRGLFYWAVHHDRMNDGTHWLLRAADKAWPLRE